MERANGLRVVRCSDAAEEKEGMEGEEEDEAKCRDEECREEEQEEGDRL